MADNEIIDEGDPRDRPPRDNLVRAMETTEFRSDGAEDGRLGTLVGRMASYDTWAVVRSQVEGHFLERIAPGAFDKTFAENRARMKVIYDHGLDAHIGRNALGPLEDIIDDGSGIDYRAALIDTDYNRNRILPQLRAGVLGSSFRFDAVKDNWKRRPQPSDYNPDGLPERTIHEAKVIELGPTPFPVYDGTSATVRSLTDEFLVSLVAGQSALPKGPEARPQSVEGSRAAPAAHPIPLDEFLEILRGNA